MSWVKLDDQLADHPKILRAGPLAAWLYVASLTYCNRLATDGRIPREQVPRLAVVDSPDQLAETLVKVGLWERTDDGFQVHDYLEYQPSAEQVRDSRDKARERVRAARAKRTDAHAKRSHELRVDSTEGSSLYPGPATPGPATPVLLPSETPVQEQQQAAAAAAAAAAPAQLFVDAFYEARAVDQQRQTRTFRRRELAIAGQLVEAGATPDEARQVVAQCGRAPTDLRDYESRRLELLAELSGARSMGRNGRAGPPGHTKARASGVVDQEHTNRACAVAGRPRSTYDPPALEVGP